MTAAACAGMRMGNCLARRQSLDLAVPMLWRAVLLCTVLSPDMLCRAVLRVQGDKRFAEVMGLMGADVQWSPYSITITGPKAAGKPLKGIDHDCNDIPDAAMTLAVAALFAAVRGLSRLCWRGCGAWILSAGQHHALNCLVVCTLFHAVLCLVGYTTW